MSHQVLGHVDEYLQVGIDYECSDIHLPAGYPPAWRRFGTLSPIWDDHAPLTAEDTERLARSFLTEDRWEHLQKVGDIDFAYASETGRFRASVIKQRLGYEIVFRIVPNQIRTMEDLGLPMDSLIPLTRYQNGLILVTGAVGAGKSTTMAAIVDFTFSHWKILSNTFSVPRSATLTNVRFTRTPNPSPQLFVEPCEKIQTSSSLVRCAISKQFPSPSPLRKPVTW